MLAQRIRHQQIFSDPFFPQLLFSLFLPYEERERERENQLTQTGSLFEGYGLMAFFRLASVNNGLCPSLGVCLLLPNDATI